MVNTVCLLRRTSWLHPFGFLYRMQNTVYTNVFRRGFSIKIRKEVLYRLPWMHSNRSFIFLVWFGLFVCLFWDSASNLWSPCLSLLSAGITGMHHQPASFFLFFFGPGLNSESHAYGQALLPREPLCSPQLTFLLLPFLLYFSIAGYWILNSPLFFLRL
jgi:hypothetical protein